jgi:hypothetical protein
MVSRNFESDSGIESEGMMNSEMDQKIPARLKRISALGQTFPGTSDSVC